jgi:zinc protease
MTSKRVHWGVAVAVALVSAQCAPKRVQYTINYAEQRAKLPNGLKLVVIPDQSTQLVQVDVRYEVGSNEDPPEKAGLAHYAEHIAFMFRLWGEDGPNLFTVLPQVASFNAYTSADRTHYHLQAPKEDLPLLLGLEAGRMRATQTMCEAVPDAEFARELDVVRNEIRRGAGQAEGLIFPTILRDIFGPDHPYSRTPGGLDENLVRITKEDVCQFFRDYYHPSRATLLVAGNVNPDEVGKLAMQAFGDIPAGDPKPRTPVPHVQTEHRRIVHDLALERPTVAIAWSLPPLKDEESAKAAIAAGSLSARAARFARDWDFAQSCGAFPLGANPRVGTGAHSPVLLLMCDLYRNEDAERAFDYMWRAAARAHWGVRHAEDAVENPDDETVAVQKADYILSLEQLSSRTEEVANLIQFGEGFDFHGGDTYILNYLSKLDEVDVDGLRAFVRDNLDKRKGIEFFFRVDPKGQRADQRAAGRLAQDVSAYDQENAAVDPANAHKPMTYPKDAGLLASAERYELSNGMKVVLLRYETLPIMSARLVFSAGSVHEPQDRTGVAQAAASFLQTPPGASIFWRTGIQTRSGSGSYSSWFSTRGINLYQEEMIQALERWVVAGVYEQRRIESWQENLSKSYKLPSVRQRERFSREIAAALYGPEHPLTLTGAPTMDSYKRLGRDALNGFRRKHYSASNATLYVVGNFDVETVKKEIRSHFGRWGRGHRDETIQVPAVERHSTVYLGAVGRDVLNAQVRIFFPGPMGVDDKEPERLIAARMLGQAVWRLRTRLGTTYGISGGWSPTIGPSTYFVVGPFDAAHGVETLRMILEELENLRSGTNLEVEFVRARQTVMRALLSDSIVTGDIAATLASQDARGLPADARWQTIKAVANAKPEDVKAILERERDLSRAVVALEGGEETLHTLFEAIGAENPKILPMPE